MPAIPLQRSKALLESDNWHVWKVETWSQWSGRRTDLFNMCDLVAIREDRSGVTGIQACAEDVQEHVRKLMEGWTDKKGKVYGPNEYLPVWLKAGNPFFIWGWRLRKHEGTKDTWQLREVEFIIDDGIVVHRETTKCATD